MPNTNAITRCTDCRALMYADAGACRNCGGADSAPLPLRPFAIASRGNSYVLDPSNWTDIYTFATRKEARRYASSILREMPSKDCPLRVVVYNGSQHHG